MTGHRDIPDEVVKRAQLYDHEHWRADRNGERGGSWGSVPPEQVRRLLWGARPDAVDLLSLPWRTGRKVGRTMYARLGPEASDEDPLIGMMDTPELAAAAVAAHNYCLNVHGEAGSNPRYCSDG